MGRGVGGAPRGPPTQKVCTENGNKTIRGVCLGGGFFFCPPPKTPTKKNTTQPNPNTLLRIHFSSNVCGGGPRGGHHPTTHLGLLYSQLKRSLGKCQATLGQTFVNTPSCTLEASPPTPSFMPWLFRLPLGPVAIGHCHGLPLGRIPCH